jgi:hypothetical protein
MTQNATLEATKAELTIRKASEDRFMLECNSITSEKGISVPFFFCVHA